MEKSCGAVIYKKENGKFLFLLELQSNGHYSFPKGHIANNETEVECAKREIKEETNLDVIIDTNFKYTISYFIGDKKIYKDATYFVAVPKTFNLLKQDSEILECNWYTYEEVLSRLEYSNIKEVFYNAYKYILNIENKQK